MHERFMKRALELAEKGWGRTNPNPLVGAVIVKDGVIIGEGAHERLGRNHAEINALKSVRDKVKGAHMYVTLEPCSHYGKTPPCALALASSGISKVFIAMGDPNPKVSGRGIQMLKDAGNEVEIGIMEKEAKKLNEIFIKYTVEKKPFVIMKTAMSFDGKIACHTGDSKWITGETSRRYVHKIRERVSGIMVGINTVIQDNPYLTARLDMDKEKDPIRIIIDSKGRIPDTANVFDKASGAYTLVVTTEAMANNKERSITDNGAKVLRISGNDGRVDLKALMTELYKMDIDSILLEGGSTLNASALECGIVDKVMFFYAPKIIGGINAPGPIGGKGAEIMRECWNIYDVNMNSFDNDILLEGYIKKHMKG